MKKFKNVLLINDDGYNSYGIRITKRLLEKYAERVVIVAPKEHMSGKSSSITINEPLNLVEVDEDVYHLNGSPVDCALFGILNLNIKFDLVVSGCNQGENLTYDVLYSGTIGGALEAIKLHHKAIAFSCPENRFNEYEKNFDLIMEFVLKKDLISDQYLLSVNTPKDVATNIKLTRLSSRDDIHSFIKKGGSYYLTRKISEKYDSKTDDWYAFMHNTISITPLRPNFFSETLYKELNKKL